MNWGYWDGETLCTSKLLNQFIGTACNESIQKIAWDRVSGLGRVFVHAGGFGIKTMSGQCSTLMVYEIDGFRPTFLKLFEYFGSMGGYSAIFVTLCKGNRHIPSFIKEGYKIIHELYNRRSGNDVVYLVKEVTKVLTPDQALEITCGSEK